MSNLVQNGRFTRYIEKLLNLKGGASIYDISAGLQMVLALQSGAEHRYLESVNLYAASTFVGANATHIGEVMLRNPVGSGVVAVFQRVMFLDAVADNPILIVNPQTTNLTNVVSLTGARLDARNTNSPVLILSSQNAAKTAQISVVGLATIQGTCGVNVPFFDFLVPPNEIPLMPGDALQLESADINQAFLTSFLWRERALESSELT